MKIVIDRFENDYAIVELPDGNTLRIPKELFPGARENDVFYISFNLEETEERRNTIQKRFDKLKK